MARQGMAIWHGKAIRQLRQDKAKQGTARQGKARKDSQIIVNKIRNKVKYSKVTIGS
jgi:hypothetical protein